MGRGEKIAVLSHNGAGRSSLARMIAGIDEPGMRQSRTQHVDVMSDCIERRVRWLNDGL
ncbi:hypothetical protein [Rhizobium sp. P40RR-XXII]|uniref:hypothetical protein n=1 Tax=unclassified Rhizobium TaxID=2613769 RepID=UPI003917B9A0